MLNPKLKKKIIQARNKRKNLILQHERMHREEHARIIDEEDAAREEAKRRAAAEGREEDEVWSAKTQEIKDKLRKKKRKSKDRWNRFAGTSDGGGRGR